MLFFTPEEKKLLLNRIPAIELSYEPKLHKKVYAPIYYVIPKGPKALVWYTYWKDQNVCLLVRLNERGNYSDVQVFTTTFADALALGTIIYGTYFMHHNQHFFTCEKLYYYKGIAVVKKPYEERMGLLLEMFESQIEQLAYTPASLVVGMPFMTDNYDEALAQMEVLPYKTYGVAATGFNKSTYGAAHAQATHVTAMHASTTHAPATHAQHAYAHVFKVKACLAADNYSLYTAEDTFFETAMVPTYKCSVMLNSLFRHIKENSNLDLLEESDDESEFENAQIDKFVDLEKTLTMECVYSKRFKKWQPIKMAAANSKIVSMRELLK